MIHTGTIIYNGMQLQRWAKEIVIFKSTDFTFPAGVGNSAPVPQNIDLTKPLDTFGRPGTVHFYIEEPTTVQNEGQPNERTIGGKRAEKEKDLWVIQNLPIVTENEFTNNRPDRTAIIEIPRLNVITNTKGFGDAAIYVGRLSNSKLRIACSHPLITSGTFIIKVVQFN